MFVCIFIEKKLKLAMQKENNIPWQIELFKYSYMKKEKVNLIKSSIKKIDNNSKVIDIGCRQGVVSYFIRELGGKWLHCDTEMETLKTASSILKKNIVQIGESLPFKKESADYVFSLDILEHLDDDKALLNEIYRVLKTGGKIVISTPISGKFFLLNKIKMLFGMKPEVYGHKREGYSLKKLNRMVEDAGLKILKSTTYSKFFTELVELSLNIIFVKLIKRKRKSQLRTGSISPESEDELKGNKKIYILYQLIYPFLRAITLLDKLLFFKTGYATFIIAEKE